MKFIDLAGHRFGKLSVRGRMDNIGRKTAWSCICDCGARRVIAGSNLVNGHTTSCGCEGGKFRHGMTGSPEHRAWLNMIQRCTNPRATRYERYGGRGIKICERWLSFENFFSDVGPRPSLKHSIDRINNDGNYEPDNVRWATATDQQRNVSRNRVVNVEGENLCVAAAAERTGVKLRTVRARLAKGGTFEAVFSKRDYRSTHLQLGSSRHGEASE